MPVQWYVYSQSLYDANLTLAYTGLDKTTPYTVSYVATTVSCACVRACVCVCVCVFVLSWN